MQGTRTVQAQQPLMVWRCIAFVTCESICRIYRIHMIHIIISGGFRQYRGRADRRFRYVAVDNGTGRQYLAQTVQIGQLVAIYQHVVGRHAHRQQSAAHGEKRGLQDIQRIDFGMVRPADAEANGLAFDFDAQASTLFRGQRLGIRDALDAPPRPQNDGSRHHRSGQRSAACFVDSGDSPHAGAIAEGRSCSSSRMACAAKVPAPRRSSAWMREKSRSKALRRSVSSSHIKSSAPIDSGTIWS